MKRLYALVDPEMLTRLLRSHRRLVARWADREPGAGVVFVDALLERAIWVGSSLIRAQREHERRPTADLLRFGPDRVHVRRLAPLKPRYVVLWDNGTSASGTFSQRFTSRQAAETYGREWAYESNVRDFGTPDPDEDGYTYEVIEEEIKPRARWDQILPRSR